MANFYSDNSDIKFLFKHIDLRSVAALQEENFRFAGEFDYAPKDADEALRNYEIVLESLGQLAAEFIAPRAEQVDKDGNVLNPDGTVSYAKGIRESLTEDQSGTQAHKNDADVLDAVVGQEPFEIMLH